jgi:HD domain-containing protein
MARLNELVRNDDSPQEGGAGSRPKGESNKASFKNVDTAASQVSMERQAQLILDADLWHAQAEMELPPIVGAVRSAQTFSLGSVTQVVDGFVNSLAQGDRLLVKAISAERGGLIITNLINTSLIAIKIGMGLQYSREDLMRLGVAAILHDVGMCLIPEGILNKPGPLSQEERILIKRHPELGAQALRKLCPEADWIAEIVLQEHERVSGQGYPRGLKGEEIHEFAQIIGLADTFEALLHARPYRNRFLPHEAVRELVTKEKTSFPTKVLKCLIQQFSVFPLGTHVLLNTGESAEVVELNPQYPLRPVVKVFKDTHGVSVKEARTLDLSKSSLVHVSEVVQDAQ